MHTHMHREIESHMLGVRVLFAGTLFIYLLINALPVHTQRERERRKERETERERESERERHRMRLYESKQSKRAKESVRL